MGTLILPNDIEALTAADAAEVQQNYQVTAQFINNNVIHRDGAKAMTGQLTLVGDPVDDKHAASKRYVDSFLPVGSMMLFAGGVSPAGNWALCDGASKSTATYPELFAVLGYKYGGSGGTFMLPDLRGRIVIARSDDARFNVVGEKGGAWTVPVPQHKHTMNHNHGLIASGIQSASHKHNVNPASLSTSTAADHTHPFSYIADAQTGGSAARIATYVTGGLHSADGPGGSHSHTVDIPSTATGDNLANHTHNVDMPNYVGDTGNTGTANVDHVPPYLVVNYIIRTS